jgi:ATP-dependent Clp protease adaptor protein ClpS
MRLVTAPRVCCCAATCGPPSAPVKPVRKKHPKSTERVKLAPLYRVIIHNDDVTPMDFVVRVLKEVFHKAATEAVRIMLEAHVTGAALVAVMPLEQAELRVEQAHSLARTAKYPLRFSYEPVEE